MKGVTEKRLIPINYGVEYETGEIVPITSKSFGLNINCVQLLDKDGLPISDRYRYADNITIALVNNNLKSYNNGFAYNIVKNYDRTKSYIPWDSKIPSSGFVDFSGCEFIWGSRNNFPYFKIVDLDDGFSFTFEKNLITLEFQGDKLCFVPLKLSSESLEKAFKDANDNDNYDALIKEALFIDNVSVESTMYFKFLWQEFILKAKECDWKKVTHI